MPPRLNADLAARVASVRVRPADREVLYQRNGRIPEHVVRGLSPDRLLMLYLGSLLSYGNMDARAQLEAHMQDIMRRSAEHDAFTQRFCALLRRILNRMS